MKQRNQEIILLVALVVTSTIPSKTASTGDTGNLTSCNKVANALR